MAAAERLARLRARPRMAQKAAQTNKQQQTHSRFNRHVACSTAQCERRPFNI